LKARGNYEIDMTWRKGQVTNLKIKSTSNATATVLMNGKILTVKTVK
jgi:hypothetical protein